VAKEKHIVRASAEEIEAMLARGEGKTDWNRVRSISQEEAERLADEDDGPLSEDWSLLSKSEFPLARKAYTSIWTLTF
jgi:hypothetical protein